MSGELGTLTGDAEPWCLAGGVGWGRQRPQSAGVISRVSVRGSVSVCPVCVCMHTCMHTHAHVCACIQCTRVCMCSCMTHVCAHTCACARSPVLCDRSRRVCNPACQQGAAWAWVLPNIPGAPGEEKQRWIRPAFLESGSKSLPRWGWAHQGAGLCRLPDVQPWAPLDSLGASVSPSVKWGVPSSWHAGRTPAGGTGRWQGSGQGCWLSSPAAPAGGRTSLGVERLSAWRSSPQFLPAGRTQEGRALQAPL